MVTAAETSKIVISAGFGGWLLLSVFNHLSDFRGTLAFVARFMKISALDEEPAIQSQLRSRRVENATVHRLALLAIILGQTLLGALLTSAAWLFLRGDEIARAVAQYAFGGLAAFWFAFVIAGTWFGYWIRQSDLERTHLTLLGLAMLGSVIVNA